MRWALALGFLFWAIAAPAPAAGEPGPAMPKITIGKKGLEVETADGAFKARVFGRLHADATVHAGDTPGRAADGSSQNPTDGTEVRRGRLSTSITAYEDWKWMGEVDFADNDVSIKDFFLEYKGLDVVKLTAGHQKQPYSLSVEMSSNDIPFTERSIDNGLIIPVIDRAIGGRFDAHGEHWFVAGGIYGDGAESGDENATEGFGSAMKVVFAPIIEEDRTVHIGFRGAVRRPEENNESLRFRSETTNMSDYNVVDTGNIVNIDEAVLYGPEAAVAFGPFSIFGEYNQVLIRRSDANSLHFQSGHIGAAWSITGESRAAAYTIKSGEFKRLRPARNFSLKNGGCGAWELAARFAYIDATNGSATDPGQVRGGEQQTFDAAVNWYPNPVVRFMLGWAYVVDTRASSSDFNEEGKGLSAFTFRTQITF